MRIRLHEVVRSPGQKLIPVQMSDEFIEKVNEALPKLGYSDRSKFIREAIVEKLAREGIIVPVELSLPPARVGKGGYPSHVTNPAALNEPRVIEHTKGSKKPHAEQQYETRKGAIVKRDKKLEEAARNAMIQVASKLPKSK